MKIYFIEEVSVIIDGEKLEVITVINLDGESNLQFGN
jgi:hypothetical protein